MNIYISNSVKYWSDNFRDLKSFDIVDDLNLKKRFFDTSKFIEGFNNSDVKNVAGWNRGEKVSLSTVNRKVKPGKKYLYLELPYEFFNHYFEEWLGEVCSVDDTFIGEKTVNCFCYKCKPPVKAESGHTYYSLSWPDIKSRIENTGTFPNSKIRPWKTNTPLDDISYDQFKLFEKYGIANPIFNFSDTWPKIGSHRMAFTSIVESDVPIFFLLGNGNEFVIKGMWPYFKDKKYCHLKIIRDKKKVEFYLSLYWSNFDEDRDEKVGEISYK
jgi:hypothetical protein